MRGAHSFCSRAITPIRFAAELQPSERSQLVTSPLKHSQSHAHTKEDEKHTNTHNYFVFFEVFRPRGAGALVLSVSELTTIRFWIRDSWKLEIDKSRNLEFLARFGVKTDSWGKAEFYREPLESTQKNQKIDLPICVAARCVGFEILGFSTFLDG